MKLKLILIGVMLASATTSLSVLWVLWWLAGEMA
jgi:hypothetical protein